MLELHDKYQPDCVQPTVNTISPSNKNYSKGSKIGAFSGVTSEPIVEDFSYKDSNTTRYFLMLLNLTHQKS